jgi:hypothetical protein
LAKGCSTGDKDCAHRSNNVDGEFAMTEVKKRDQKTNEEKRILMANVTKIAFESEARRRAMDAAKTVRLRALRLAADQQQAPA